MNSQILSKKLLQDLDEIKFQYENILERAYRSIYNKPLSYLPNFERLKQKLNNCI